MYRKWKVGTAIACMFAIPWCFALANKYDDYRAVGFAGTAVTLIILAIASAVNIDSGVW